MHTWLSLYKCVTDTLTKMRTDGFLKLWVCKGTVHFYCNIWLCSIRCCSCKKVPQGNYSVQQFCSTQVRQPEPVVYVCVWQAGHHMWSQPHCVSACTCSGVVSMRFHVGKSRRSSCSQQRVKQGPQCFHASSAADRWKMSTVLFSILEFLHYSSGSLVAGRLWPWQLLSLRSWPLNFSD